MFLFSLVVLSQTSQDKGQTKYNKVRNRKGCSNESKRKLHEMKS